MKKALFFLIGLIGGLFGGGGMGGGTLLIPLLSIFIGLPQSICQGINLLSFLLMALFSLYLHNKNNFLRFDGYLYITIAGVITSFLSSLLATTIDGRILKIVFGIFLCILGLFQFVKVLKKQKK